MKHEHLVGFLIGVLSALLTVYIVYPITEKDNKLLTHHAALAATACTQLGLESVSMSSSYSGVTNAYTIISNCTQNLTVTLQVPKPKVFKKET